MNKEIQLHKEETIIINKVKELDIVDSSTMETATEMLSQLNKTSDRITEETEKVTRPLLDALNAERKRWKPSLDLLKESIDIVRTKITKYQTEARRLAQIEEEKIAARIGDGRGKLSITTAIKKINNIEKIESNIKTESGSISFKTVIRFEVIDLDAVPNEYLQVDEIRVRQALKDGKQITGIRKYTEDIPINRR
jgi:hypothetical protein